jgi:hypothetical protein
LISQYMPATTCTFWIGLKLMVLRILPWRSSLVTLITELHGGLAYPGKQPLFGVGQADCPPSWTIVCPLM